MAPNFDPNPKDSIDLFGQRHVVQPHPQVSYMPFSQLAGRAVVHQVRDENGTFFALKVFKKQYRDPNLVDSTEVLSRIETFEGLRAAHRRIVLPSDTAARKYRNLEYSMLMSWIHGTTWFDVLGQAREEGYCLRLPVAVRLCNRFLEVLEGLEKAGIAHTDISPGNVMVAPDVNDVQLLDLEDMYMPGTPTPSRLNVGSAGYRHRSGDEGETCWRPEGDRYAAAVLAAEMLILTNPKLAREVTDEGFFTDHHGTSEGMDQFKEAQSWLEEIAPEFARVFEHSWFAGSLEDCPRVSELRAPIKDLASTTIDDVGPIIEEDPIAENGSTTDTPATAAGGKVTFEPLFPTNPGSSARKTPQLSPRHSTKPSRSSPRLPNGAKKVVDWSHGQVDEKEQVDEAGDPVSAKPLLIAGAVVFALFILILIIIAASQ